MSTTPTEIHPHFAIAVSEVFFRKNDNTRIYGCVIHVDIRDGKIWVQHDGTEEAIADQLVEKGVAKKEIVIAYHAPNLRKYTEFAVK